VDKFDTTVFYYTHPETLNAHFLHIFFIYLFVFRFPIDAIIVNRVDFEIRIVSELMG